MLMVWRQWTIIVFSSGLFQHRWKVSGFLVVSISVRLLGSAKLRSQKSVDGWIDKSDQSDPDQSIDQIFGNALDQIVDRIVPRPDQSRSDRINHFLYGIWIVQCIIWKYLGQKH